MQVLDARDVFKSFQKHKVLNGMEMRINQGGSVALLGTNGAGKTTFIKILSTILSKDNGNVTICGYDSDKNSKKIQSMIGYVGQDTERSGYARLTVKENLMFFGSIRGIEKKELNSRISKLIEYFEFEDNYNKQFMTLSGGQKQTMVVMRALLHDPTLIILDEPTKGLDPVMATKMRNFLKNYVTNEKKSLLLTSHIFADVEQIADEVAIMDGGKIVLKDHPEALKKRSSVTDYIDFKLCDLDDSVIGQLNSLDVVKTKVIKNEELVSFGVDDFYEAVLRFMEVLKKNSINPAFSHHPVTLEDIFIQEIKNKSREASVKID